MGISFPHEEETISESSSSSETWMGSKLGGGNIAMEGLANVEVDWDVFLVSLGLDRSKRRSTALSMEDADCFFARLLTVDSEASASIITGATRFFR